MVFVNNTLNMVGARDKPLNPLLDELKEIGVKLVPVGVGERAKLSDLNKIASDDVTALHYGEYESPKTLGEAVIQGKLQRKFDVGFGNVINNSMPENERKQRKVP